MHSILDFKKCGGVATYIVTPTHIVFGDNLCRYSWHIFLCRYLRHILNWRPAAYCRWGETFTVLHILSSAKIQAKVCRMNWVPSCRERETLYLSLDSWECSVYMVVFNRFVKNLNNHIYNVKFIHLLLYFLLTRRSRKAIFRLLNMCVCLQYLVYSILKRM